MTLFMKASLDYNSNFQKSSNWIMSYTLKNPGNGWKKIEKSDMKTNLLDHMPWGWRTDYSTSPFSLHLGADLFWISSTNKNKHKPTHYICIYSVRKPVIKNLMQKKRAYKTRRKSLKVIPQHHRWPWALIDHHNAGISWHIESEKANISKHNRRKRDTHR